MFDQPSLFGPRVLTVSGVTQYLRALMESDQILRDVWISGEVSTLSTPGSGHIYFTIKDGGASLRCVIWRTQAARMGMRLQSGMALEVHGYISLYEAGGQYQLYVDAVRLAGEGLLYQEFMRLKTRLEAEGLFDPERKRPLPTFPNRLGIVTSPTGAALQDMLNTLSQRFPLVEVVLAPTLVQGEEAPTRIVKAIEDLNHFAKVDLILLARGGGSLEDLWAFNDERVVRAVTNSDVPVITGVGHETDFTLADFAADLRAPTPTGAAVLAVPDAADLLRNLQAVTRVLDNAFEGQLWQHRQLLSRQVQRLSTLSPRYQIRNDTQRLDELAQRLERSLTHQQALRVSRLEGHAQRLAALSPLQVLQRGYAVVRDQHGKLVRSVTALRAGAQVSIRLADGQADAQITSTPTE